MAGPKRVLIAEDESIIRMDLREMLEEEGYEVVEAGDGREAIRLARDTHPDLVILDIKMPVLDGLSAARTITGEGIAPCVILSAFSQRDLIEQADEAGAMGYLVKPFTKNDLLPAIEIAHGRHRQMAALAREVGDLTERLEARKVVDRARGALMDAYGLSEADAFRFIQTAAMQRRMTMRQVADAILDGSIDAGP